VGDPSDIRLNPYAAATVITSCKFYFYFFDICYKQLDLNLPVR